MNIRPHALQAASGFCVLVLAGKSLPRAQLRNTRAAAALENP